MAEATANEATANEATANEATANEATANEATANEATANEATANEATANEATPTISRRDVDLLRWYFERGDSLFFASSFGPMLEKQHAYGFGEDGRRVPKAPRNGDGLRVKRRRQLDEASCLPDEDDLLRAAEASRRLERVHALDPDAARALVAYYGELGARWSHRAAGRLLAIWPLTEAGAELLARDAAKRPGRGGPFERLALELEEQERAPTPERGRWLARMQGQAENLLAKGLWLWSATGSVARRRAA